MAVPLLTARLEPSVRLAVILGLAHFAAIGMLWPLALPTTIKLAGTILFVVSSIFYLRSYALLRSPRSVVALELSDEMSCALETQHGERIICTLLGSSFVAPYLTALNLKPSGKFFTRSVVILADGIDAEQFRQLRVLLRWKWRDPA
ncbi:MAG: protein YgfX [Pseudomonadota bacterium]